MRKLLIVTVAMQLSLALPLVVRGNDTPAESKHDQADHNRIAPLPERDTTSKSASGQKKTNPRKMRNQARQKKLSGTQTKKNNSLARLIPAAPRRTNARVESPAPKPVVSLRGTSPARTVSAPQEMPAPADKEQ